MTTSDYDAILQSMRNLWEKLDAQCNATNCDQSDFAGCVLRIAGHDFMDFQPGSGGGSDGCLDFTDPDNAGLAPCMYAGEFGISVGEAWSDHCTQVSLADFFVIAAEAVMTFTRENALADGLHTGVFPFKGNFKYGRTTMESCSFSHGRLPNPENGCPTVDQVFVQNMGLSWGETAALMAVHTLGRAKIENSGYDGFWSDAESSRKFNSNYFLSMLAKGWVPEQAVGGNTKKNQWKRGDMGVRSGLGKEMMLDTDLCLAYVGDQCQLGGPGAGCTAMVLSAANTDCCAWAAPVKSNRGRRVFGLNMCGTDEIPGASNFRRQRNLCCCEGCLTGGSPRDCGLPLLNSGRFPSYGPAATEVMQFANNEAAWIPVFMTAWAKATENGFGELKPLS